jgi:TorA maturation chaperone TorD
VLAVSDDGLTSGVPGRRTLLDLRRLGRLRQDAYGLLATAFLYPQKALLTTATQVARRLGRQDRWAAELGFYGPCRRFLDSVVDLNVSSLPAMQEGYVALFSDSAFPRPVPLRESAYMDQTAMMAGRAIADLEREYGAAGLSVATAGESADHVAVEMEFVSFLCALETHSWESEDVAGALEYIQRERGFLEGHPCRWLASLARAIARRDAPSFYAQSSEAAHAMVAHDVDFLAALAASLEPQVREQQGGMA